VVKVILRVDKPGAAPEADSVAVEVERAKKQNQD
jgi:dihydroneopterin aldolase